MVNEHRDTHKHGCEHAHKHTHKHTDTQACAHTQAGTHVHTHTNTQYFMLVCSSGLTHHGFLELVGFDAADKERLTYIEGSHQQLQRKLELATQSRGSLPGVHTLATHTHTQSNVFVILTT